MRRPAGAGRRGRHGLSLLELMLVLVVVGIFIGLVLPKLRYAVAVYDLERSSRQFAADLQVAQTEAWRRSRSVQIECLSGTSYRTVVSGTSSALSQRTMDGGSTFLTDATWVCAASPSGTVLRFRPLGAPVFPGTATSLAITIRNTGAGVTLSRTVRIAQGGAVTVGS